jgi:small-conductance mechanosensitive channel
LQEFREQVLIWAGILGPNIYLKAAVAILGFILAGKIAELLISRILLKLVNRSSSNIDDELVRLLQRPVFITLVLMGLAAATRILEFSESALFVTLGILRTIAIFIWYSYFRRAFATIMAVVSDKIGKNTSIASMLPLVETVASVVMLALAVYFVFLAWDVNVTAWLASAGIIGLALSFAAKDTLANLFAGVAIAADAPYKQGDFITLESGERGMVTNIGLRSTRLLTRDDVEITVPNGIIGNGKIINEAGGHSAKHRIRAAVGVAYGSDVDQIIAVLNGVAADNEFVCKTPAPRVRFRKFGDSSLDFELLVWIERSIERGRILHEINCSIYKRFNEDGIVIPFPQRDLHVRSMPPDTAIAD